MKQIFSLHPPELRRYGFLVTLGFLLFCPALLPAQTLGFGQATYTAERGDTLVLTTAFSSPVPNGLQGYSLRLTFPEGTITLAPSDIAVPAALDYDLFGPPAERQVTSTTAVVSGFVDDGAPPYTGTAFATFTITIPLGAPLGFHTLRLDPHIPGGFSFVDGNNEGIDAALIFGTAQLEIAGDGDPPGSVYEQWAVSYGLDPATEGAPNEDANGDGVKNVVRFALGQSPLTYSQMPSASISGGFLQLPYTRSLSAAGAVTVQVEHSTSSSLASWTTTGVEDLLISTQGDSEHRLARIAASGQRGFLRVTVTGL